MNRQVLVIAAHSDDEVLGCGGTIVKHVTSGDSVHVIFMTNGVGSRKVGNKNVQERVEASKRAANILKISSIYQLDFPDNAMDSIPLLKVVQEIEKIIKNIKPDIVYTHHIGDLNIDHQTTHKAVITACRPLPKSSIKEIYSFEVLSSTEWQSPDFLPFTPNVYIDIGKNIDTKFKALKEYDKEMCEDTHSRTESNLLRQDRLRGSQCGVKFAEAFMCIRLIKL